MKTGRVRFSHLKKGVNRYLSLLVCAVAVCLVSACAGVRQPPDVLFIVIDALRADHVGAYGYSRDTTPGLDKIARRGTLFTRAYSQSASTLPSVASAFTSMYPFEHGVILSKRYTLEPAHVTLPEVLAEKGYRTGFFSANPLFAYTLGKGEPRSPGFEQGFDDFKVFNRFFRDAMRAPELSEQVSRWIMKGRGRQPFFAYVHYVEPHVPYAPPEDFRKRYPDSYNGEIDGSTKKMREITVQATRVPETARRHLINLYDAEIASADAAISKMLISLEDNGVLDNALVIVTADHGEAFYEHGMWQHTTGLYEEFIHVPLVIIPPHSAYQPALATNNEIVGLVDLMPTILDYVDLPENERPPSMRGSSLRPLLESREPGPEIEDVTLERGDAIAQIDIGRPPEPLLSGRMTAALVTPRFKLIESKLPHTEIEVSLFDLQRDPQEQHPLAHDGKHEQQLRTLRTRLGEIASRPELTSPIALPENLRERLRALGYL